MAVCAVTGRLAGADLPDLRIVDRASLALHEEADERRVEALTRHMTTDGVLRNPPIVAPMSAGRFVVLDGANRTMALHQLEVRDVLVQVVDYDDVTLTTWHHLVVGIAPDVLGGALGAIPGLHVGPSSLAAARSDLLARRTIAYVVTPGGDVHGLVGGREVGRNTFLLRQVVASYRGIGRIHRVQSDDVVQLRALYGEVGLVVVFPSYGPGDILAMAEQAAKLPSGITRHVIARRALRLNVGLDVLRADMDRVAKNRWLGEWLRGRLQSGRVRYYQEPTILFDE